MPYETADREKIDEIVRQFYAVVLEDELLKPIFIKSLGADLNAGKWETHLHTLSDFWVLMITGKRGYGGNPFPPHAFLGPLTREMFERWLELFKKTVYEMFVPDIADSFYKKADILAEQFMDNLGVDDEDE
jgi:hemoglobin